MDHTKTYQADLDLPCRELSVRGLGFVVALLVRWQIYFSCSSTVGAIQLYLKSGNLK